MRGLVTPEGAAIVLPSTAPASVVDPVVVDWAEAGGGVASAPATNVAATPACPRNCRRVGRLDGPSDAGALSGSSRSSTCSVSLVISNLHHSYLEMGRRIPLVCQKLQTEG